MKEMQYKKDFLKKIKNSKNENRFYIFKNKKTKQILLATEKNRFSVDLEKFEKSCGIDFFSIKECGGVLICKDNLFAFIEKDGFLFEFKNRLRFEEFYRYDDGSTVVKIEEKKYLIEKDGTPFFWQGKFSFENIWRDDINGNTKIMLENINEPIIIEKNKFI